jgi:hypothetical protein
LMFAAYTRPTIQRIEYDSGAIRVRAFAQPTEK